MSKPKIIRLEFDPSNPPMLTNAQRAELERLVAMSDDDIDVSDIAALTATFLENGVRGKFFRPVKKQVTVRLDADVLAWFKTQQGGARGYQTAINAALREYMAEELRKAD